jgi:hypothetical protein
MYDKTKDKKITIEKPKLNSKMIVEVYEENFAHEILRLSVYLEKFKFIAMVNKLYLI